MQKRKRNTRNKLVTLVMLAIMILAGVKLVLPKANEDYQRHSQAEEAARLQGDYLLAFEHANKMVEIALQAPEAHSPYVAFARRGSLELLMAQQGDVQALQRAMDDYASRYDYSCEENAIESQILAFGYAGFPQEGQEVMFAAPCQVPLLYQALSFAYLNDEDSVQGRMIEFGEGNFPELTDLSDAELWVVFRIYTLVGDQQMVTQINEELAKRFPPQR
jgi:hypothetical protein